MQISLISATLTALFSLANATPVAHPVTARPMEKREFGCFSPSDFNTVCEPDDAMSVAQQYMSFGAVPISVDSATPVVLITGKTCALSAFTTTGSTSSFARDIGAGALTIVNDCNNGATNVLGENSAGGNGAFLIQFTPLNH